MSSVAFLSGGTAVYWSSLMIALGLLSGLLLTMALAPEELKGAVPGFFLLAVLFSFLFCRLLHFYCHSEQYTGWESALTDYTTGGFCLSGALAGIWLASLPASGFSRSVSRGALLDASAPGIALSLAFLRLSCLFNTACRGSFPVQAPALQRLPFATLISFGGDYSEYRFAAFFISFLLLLGACVFFLRHYLRHRMDPVRPLSAPDGHTWRMFLAVFCGAELVLDSIRYDSSYLHFPGAVLSSLNKYVGFIGIAQLISALVLLGLLIFYCRRSRRAGLNGRPVRVMPLVFLLGLIGVGVCEYLVQRYTGLYFILYLCQTLCAAVMVFPIVYLYRAGRAKSVPA